MPIEADEKPQKVAGAYKIIRDDDQVVYVGSTGNLYNRYCEHRAKKSPKNLKLYEISTNQSLRFIPILAKDRDHAYDLEQTLLDQYFGSDFCINKSNDARYGAKGHVITPETQVKMTASRIGVKKSEETKKKMSESNAQKKSIIIDGIQYASYREAARATGLSESRIGTIARQLDSPDPGRITVVFE